MGNNKSSKASVPKGLPRDDDDLQGTTTSKGRRIISEIDPEEWKLLEPVRKGQIVYLFGTKKSLDIYNRRFVKYIVKQEKKFEDDITSMGHEGNIAILSSDSCVKYAPIGASSHTMIVIPQCISSDSITSKKYLVFGGKKQIPSGHKSNMGRSLKKSEDALLTYYDCGLNIWLYGENTIHKYNTEDERPDPSLFYHSFTFNPKNMKAYIFGGSSNDSKRANFLVSNKLYCLNLENWTWKQIRHRSTETTNSSFVTPVRGHAAIYRSRTNSIVVYAGNLGGSSLTNGMFEFDCDTEQWTRIQQHETVPSRAYHNAVYCKSRDWMIVFGGEFFDQGSSRLEIVNDMCLFDFGDKQWQSVAFRGDDNPPVSTFGHCTTIVYDRFVVTYGGCDREYNPKSQCMIFDLFERRWTRLNVKLAAIEVSAKHTLDSSENQEHWKLSYQCELPPLNCAAMIYDEQCDCLVFYGGYTTAKDKCSYIFKVKFDIALLLVTKHFKFISQHMSDEEPNITHDLRIISFHNSAARATSTTENEINMV
ncbi:hypothetical protein C9374_003285 [Naegleria lovaniensis]|uniref:Uncharacterized protein n=1 Tax=Naegleria lovaniensis TaxID=51637 RepID=A0AA88GRD5_NAELO|nr:uncharacterized protein C9374_003285 [Naegleria lovaniensis]KAG2385470.1 hypothetical protein C9374_003285 [Naegleria lovaniensis]